MCQGVPQLPILGMGDLPPLIGHPYDGYINPYYWVDDHPLTQGTNVSLDPSTYICGTYMQSNDKLTLCLYITEDVASASEMRLKYNYPP